MVTSCEWLEGAGWPRRRAERCMDTPGLGGMHRNCWFPWGLAALALLFGDPGENLLYIELASLPELL